MPAPSLRRSLLAPIAALALGAACSGDDAAEDRAADTTTAVAPGPTGGATAPPASTSAPRPDGEAPAVGLGALVALERPSALADPPGPGPVLVSTLGGGVVAVDLASGAAAVVLDLSDRISTGGERGLLGLAVDPRGERLYANYTNGDGDTEIRSWPLVDGRPQDGEGVLHLFVDQPYANHNGGHLVFGPDGALWVGTGDGGGAGDPDDRAQDAQDLLGKMLRVAPATTGGVQPAPGNPDWGGRPEVWATGLRNPWRYSFDRATNRLWVADVGQGAVEEVSVAEPQAARPNFGWDDVEGDRGFEGEPSSAFVAPVVTYTHDDGCSVTGGYVYRGGANAGLYGWYLFGDYCGGWVRAVPSSDPGRDPVELLADVGPVLSFGELEDGELVLLTDRGLQRLTAG